MNNHESIFMSLSDDNLQSEIANISCAYIFKGRGSCEIQNDITNGWLKFNDLSNAMKNGLVCRSYWIKVKTTKNDNVINTFSDFIKDNSFCFKSILGRLSALKFRKGKSKIFIGKELYDVYQKIRPGNKVFSPFNRTGLLNFHPKKGTGNKAFTNHFELNAHQLASIIYSGQLNYFSNRESDHFDCFYPYMSRESLLVKSLIEFPEHWDITQFGNQISFTDLTTPSRSFFGYID